MAFTLFALGTGETYPSEKGKTNINTQFYDAVKGDKYILQGPPANLNPAKEIETNIKLGLKKISSWLADPQNRDPQDRKFHLNLSGFSRGAVTCLKLANALQRKLEGNEISGVTPDDVVANIYAEDPVAGLGDKADEDGRNVPLIVKHYVAILQLDEQRRAFKPQDSSRLLVSDLKSSSVTFLPMYGNHTNTIQIKNHEMKDCAVINWNLKYQFLKRNGTVFDNNDQLPEFPALKTGEKLFDEERTPASDEQLLEYYADAKKNRKAYLRHAQKIQLIDIPVPATDRKFKSRKKDYLADSNFFLNQHERELFKQVYPAVFNHLFEGAIIADSDVPIQDRSQLIKNDFEKMQKTNRLLLEKLKKDKKVIQKTDGAGYEMPECGKEQRVEKRKLLRHLKGEDICHTIVESLNNRIILDVSIYQREKSFYMWFSERYEYDRAEDIKKQTYNIISGLAGKEDKEQQAILDNLEKHFIELKEQNSTSNLTSLLEKILNDYGRTYVVTKQKARRKIAGFVGATAIKRLGQSVQRFGLIISPVIAGTGEFLASGGKRIAERCMNDMSIKTSSFPSLCKSLLKWPFLAVGTIISGAVFLVGNSLKITGKSVGWIGRKIQAAGANLIQASGYIVLKRYVQPKEKMPAAENHVVGEQHYLTHKNGHGSTADMMDKVPALKFSHYDDVQSMSRAETHKNSGYNSLPVTSIPQEEDKESDGDKPPSIHVVNK